MDGALTLGERLAEAGGHTLIGMGIVFLVLIIISLVIALLGLIGRRSRKKAEKAPETAGPVTENVPAAETPDERELVAVIAGAIAAFEGTDTDSFRVTSIRKVSTKGKWRRG